MQYDFKKIELKWQKHWDESKLYSQYDYTKPKFYALDMFPYPSGAGLHVGHPLGYIASDIVSRYKRLKGFNVLHPIGFDAFGLPAEQYAIQTGQHPEITTENNINNYKKQLKRIGFSFDWERELRTTEPKYYKWTQWIFSLLFDAWYNPKNNKAENIKTLLEKFATEGFEGKLWEHYTEQEKGRILQNFRLAYQKETYVNWCEELGTVLANDEVKDGLSERGGHPVIQKKMKQWFLRITPYADRLLDDLNKINWSNSIKEIQKNWIGKSVGAEIYFNIQEFDNYRLTVFSTRPDTIYGVSFIVLSPEHDLAKKITQQPYKESVNAYIKSAQTKNERQRQQVKEVSGVFTGSHALHPLNGNALPIYLSEYVLSSYGTGAIMAVPAHDERDHAFAKKFHIKIIQVIESDENINTQEKPISTKKGHLINSENFDGLDVQIGSEKILTKLVNEAKAKRKINYKLRDTGFSRQRYWGEPFPIIHENSLPKLVKDLPVKLPQVSNFTPTGDGQSPLSSNKKWVHTEKGLRETDTMPGYAGSSWYFLRFMDPKNEKNFADKKAIRYWQEVDLYIGGAEHATGHLLYARFWTKFLFDLQYIPFDEPFKKLINQGMIQGESKLLNAGNRLLHIPLEYTNNLGQLTADNFIKLQKADKRFENILWENLQPKNNIVELKNQTEKMSKSKFNVVNPDDICEQYGADTLRLYEMFLGPIQDSKPWNTQGIEGVHRFLNKLWNLVFNEQTVLIQDVEPTKDSLKTLHKTIKKITNDIENFSFNTAISAFMIALNELSQQQCRSKNIIEPFIILLAPFAPHISEEIWYKLGNTESIHKSKWPTFDTSYLVENSKKYPISINGKVRTTLEFALELDQKEIENLVFQNKIVKKWLEGKKVRKFIFVPNKIINIVLG